MGVNRMTGTPWHLETLRKNDDRRHKTKCVFFCKERCFYLCEQCRGSAHCDYYREKESEDDDKDKSRLGFIGKPRRKARIPKPDLTRPANQVFSVGQKIEFRESNAGYSKRYKYKTGIIKEVKGSVLKVECEGRSGKKIIRSFPYPDCMRYIR